MMSLILSIKWTSVEKASMAGVSGVASHLCFFIYGEHHMKAPMIFRIYIALFMILLYVEIVVRDQAVSLGTIEAVEVSIAYVLSLLTSVTVYRKFFHRLRDFPGPFMASVTKLWQTMKTLDSQNHILLDDLYKRYGDFVRTGESSELISKGGCILIRSNFEGPSEITIFTPEVKWAIDGPTNQCNKAVWYDILLPLIALNTTRSKKEHDQRRRTWDHAFTVKGSAPSPEKQSDY